MKNSKSSDSLRPHPSIVFDGYERAAARFMLYPVGFKPEDFKKTLIGVSSTWGGVTPCKMHIDKLAFESQKGLNEGGDKNIPGLFIAMAQMNRPSVFVYGGTILPGCITKEVAQASRLSGSNGQDARTTTEGKLLDIVSVFEAIGARAKKKSAARNCTPSEWWLRANNRRASASHCETDRPRLFRLWLLTSTVKPVAV